MATITPGISIHAPRVGSDAAVSAELFPRPISIHAPRVGSDGSGGFGGLSGEIFQSTLPVWGATDPRHRKCKRKFISIHAPRVGSDQCDRFCGQRRCHFNPRSPCGERPSPADSSCRPLRFQSTLPVWGATYINPAIQPIFDISIHAPRVGSDRKPIMRLLISANFNPRSPCGERRVDMGNSVMFYGISIHAPRVGSDCFFKCSKSSTGRFQSTLPVWGATSVAFFRNLWVLYFNPRSPCGERPDFDGMTKAQLLISIHAPRVGSDSKDA